MFSRVKAYELRANYMSRYSYMMDSGHPEDRANSEACRLASQAWQDIAMFCQRPELVDDNGIPWEYDPESTIADIQSRWDDYCRTGIAVSDVDELAENIRDAHKVWVAKQKAWLESKAKTAADKAALSKLSNLASNGQVQASESKATQAAGQKRKNSQKPPEANANMVSAEPSELPEQPEESPRIEKIDEENRKYIQVDAIDFVIAEIRSELDCSRELAELASY